MKIGAEEKEEKEVFFFKQRTAYEILLSLVGSEICIRVSLLADRAVRPEPDVVLALSLIHILRCRRKE